MNSDYPAASGEIESRRQLNRQKRSAGAGSIVVLIMVWLILVAGAYYGAKTYFDRTVLKIQETNSMNVQVLSERLDGLALEIRELKVLLNVADQAIAASGSLQQDLNARITLLDEQLKNLEQSLKILQEAP